MVNSGFGLLNLGSGRLGLRCSGDRVLCGKLGFCNLLLEKCLVKEVGLLPDLCSVFINLDVESTTRVRIEPEDLIRRKIRRSVGHSNEIATSHHRRIRRGLLPAPSAVAVGLDIEFTCRGLHPEQGCSYRVNLYIIRGYDDVAFLNRLSDQSAVRGSEHHSNRTSDSSDQINRIRIILTINRCWRIVEFCDFELHIDLRYSELVQLVRVGVPVLLP